MTPVSALNAAAQAVCASSLNGFCRDVGGSLGCRNGRGASGSCVASYAQLDIAGHVEQARLAVAAYNAFERIPTPTHRKGE